MKLNAKRLQVMRLLRNGCCPFTGCLDNYARASRTRTLQELQGVGLVDWSVEPLRYSLTDRGHDALQRFERRN